MLATGSSSDSIAALLAVVVFGSQFVVTWLTELPVGFEDAFPMAVALGAEPVSGSGKEVYAYGRKG